MRSSPLVAIIILNWKGLEDTQACCQSLRQVTYQNLRVYVVDNGSCDGAAEVLAKGFPEFLHIANAENLGFTGGNNAAIETAMAGGAEYVLLLNNDTEVAPDFVDRMVVAAERDPDVGMVGARIYFYNTPEIIWYGGGQIDFNRWLPIQHIGEGDANTANYSEGRETGFITGCCLLVKAAVLREVGLLSPAYGYYCEDVDWCLRAKSAGWKIWYEGSARLWHKVNRSTKKMNLAVPYYGWRNQALIARRHLPSRQAKAVLFRGFLAAMKQPIWDKASESAKAATLQGIWDGVWNVCGVVAVPGPNWFWRTLVRAEVALRFLARSLKSKIRTTAVRDANSANQATDVQK